MSANGLTTAEFSDEQAELYLQLGDELATAIVVAVLHAGGGTPQMLAVLENVITGVLLQCLDGGNDREMIELMTEQVRKHLPELRRELADAA